MSKSQDAFRTISEVSELLDTPAHVLRFWESKFTQVKPVKRAGGRRYYRPSDVDLLAGIKQLLHDDGMTIKGAQKLLREKGVKNVSTIGENIMTTASKDADTAPLDMMPVEPALPTRDVVPLSSDEQTDTSAPPPAEPAMETSNVVAIAQPAPPGAGPRLTLNLAPPAPGIPSEGDAPQADAVVADAGESAIIETPQAPQIKADPADSDSKARARVFHLIQNADAAAIAARAQKIAPLLDRMQVLHDRIATL